MVIFCRRIPIPVNAIGSVFHVWRKIRIADSIFQKDPGPSGQQQKEWNQYNEGTTISRSEMKKCLKNLLQRPDHNKDAAGLAAAVLTK